MVKQGYPEQETTDGYDIRTDDYSSFVSDYSREWKKTFLLWPKLIGKNYYWLCVVESRIMDYFGLYSEIEYRVHRKD